ncbi:MAG: hypothetical protein KZQ57_02325 [gamma proteobacterium symbiont of Lucinoma myriamae]|nr:hypothetical protein [gamma proteobacterium symbiont of Lucinoma myriamae]
MRKLQDNAFYLSLFCFFSILPCLTNAASTERFYYGNDKLHPLIEEDLSSGQQCHILSLGHGVRVKDCGDHTNYFLADHLASVHAVIDDKKQVDLSCEYGPYGKNRRASNDERCKYTGTYQWDSASRLYKSPGRVYDPAGKKFLSQDPNKQSFSPYTYTAGNPIGMYDQSGSMFTSFENLPDEMIDSIARMTDSKTFKSLRGVSKQIKRATLRETKRRILRNMDELTLQDHVAEYADPADPKPPFVSHRELSRELESRKRIVSGKLKKLKFNIDVDEHGRVIEGAILKVSDFPPKSDTISNMLTVMSAGNISYDDNLAKINLGSTSTDPEILMDMLEASMIRRAEPVSRLDLISGEESYIGLRERFSTFFTELP